MTDVMTGHQILIADLMELLAEARAFQFHDFKNTDYATPKVALDQRFRELSENTRDGRYDNKPTDEQQPAAPPELDPNTQSRPF